MTFHAFASARGLIIRDLYAGDKIRRCPTEAHPSSDNGAYFYDGRRGWVMAWDGDGKTHWWNDPDDKPWSDAEKREWAAKRRKEESRRQEGYRQAAGRAAEILRTCKPLPHNYLRSKGLPDSPGLTMPEGELFIPMRDAGTNQLVGGQIIKWLMNEREWEKKMLPGMRAKGAVLRLGPAKALETWLCEGYATGLSIEAAIRRLNLNASVLVCFSDRNMVHVAPMIKGRKFVFADHDKSGAGQRAATDTGLPFCKSDVEGEDANDFHQRAGLMAVCRQIMDLRRAAM